MIIGVDEVGRGCYAGPVCVAAVAWPNDRRIKGLDDSKKVLRADRAELVFRIRKKALHIGIGWASAREIDALGIWLALQLAASRAIEQVPKQGAGIIADGNARLLGDIPASYIVKADTKIPAVMAASNVAKLARDTYMQQIDPHFPGYAFASHVGYGTEQHKAMLAALGPCDLHRFSWRPVKAFVA
ncbi:MAG TPA: ribonuclease HII [Candidatus Saccharimonadales bacterium]|nr:ribonuclease HII [Candidatus Saccharimonadales bacterium]